MSKHEWKYYSLGGVTRVLIDSGADIANLANLDQKLWTVLSCPSQGLGIDAETLKLIDTDGDGKIRVGEVVAAAKWLTSRIKNADLIIDGSDSLPLDQIADETLLKSAKHILKSLNAENQELITLAQASDSKAIFAGTKFNGDGIITPNSTDDSALQELISNISSSYAPKVDRSGDNGVDASTIEQFYADCAAYADWKSKEIYPYGANTQAVLDTVNALGPKVQEFFTRCKLLKFDEKTAAEVAISITKIDDIALCPIAAPNPEAKLDLDSINPAYQALTTQFTALTAKSGIITEADWNEIKAILAPYTAWMGSKPASNVESLGLQKINAILAEAQKDALLRLIAEDEALQAESNSIDEVKHLMLLFKNFYRFLNNYITFTDFYRRDQRAIFEEGKLYIDQKCCDLCIKVNDMGKHADMAGLSGMFLIYCTCTNPKKAKTMNIVAVMTAGETSSLRPGKNGIFYDNAGDDWDAVVTKIVDNPISIKNAFWAPYRKFWNFCVGLLNKSAEDKDKKITADLQAKASAAAANPSAPKESKMPFDIAKFAGIFAAIGLALGAIGSLLTDIAKGIDDKPLWLVWGILAIIVIVSGPSCFIAWSKLRKRNLGPILNANGWAINSKVIVNNLFGSKLTSVAKYPKVVILNDPYLKKKSAWCWIIPALILLIAAFVVLVLTDVIVLDCLKK